MNTENGLANNRYTSDEFFHLVGRGNPSDNEANYKTLLDVIDSSCISHPPHNCDAAGHTIKFNWDKSIFTEELVIPNVICFCDIPLEHLDIHIKKYGMFGISFDRDYIVMSGARPVFYIPIHSSHQFSIFGANMLKDLEQVWRGFREHVVDPVTMPTRGRSMGRKPDSPVDASLALDAILTKEVLAYIKVFQAELSEDHPDNYYLEREWRKFGNLKSQLQDVKRLLEVIPKLVDK